MKKLLRAIFYFCVGIKAACQDFCDWYVSNRSIPRPLRNRATLVVLVLAVVAGGWGLIAAISGADLERREVPVAASSEEASSSQASSEASSEDKQEVSSSSAPAIDAMASATRFTPVTAEQLTTVLTERAKKYYENAPATVFTPPAAGDIAGWKATNSDVFGWISISNTNINYPLVIGPNTDYYTYRGYYKESSRNGVIWADSDTRFDKSGELTSTNTVLYGHNWTNCWRPVRIGNPNDVMFAQLAAYDDASFAASNPYIRITTLGGDHLYQVFAVFYTDLSFAYNYAERPGNGMQKIVDTAKAKSIHKLNVPVNAATDKFITLSTCTRVMGAGDNQRFVVMAKKIS